MLLPGQSLRGRLPILSPALRHSNLRRQVPPRLHDARDPSSEGWNYGLEYCPLNLAEMTTSTPFWDLLHAAKYDMGRTALLPIRRKACWGFFRPKKPTASRTRVPEASTLIPRPPKVYQYEYHTGGKTDMMVSGVYKGTRYFSSKWYTFYSTCKPDLICGGQGYLRPPAGLWAVWIEIPRMGRQCKLDSHKSLRQSEQNEFQSCRMQEWMKYFESEWMNVWKTGAVIQCNDGGWHGLSSKLRMFVVLSVLYLVCFPIHRVMPYADMAVCFQRSDIRSHLSKQKCSRPI